MQGNVIPFELSGAEFRNQAGITELVQPRSQNYTHFLVELDCEAGNTLLRPPVFLHLAHFAQPPLLSRRWEARLLA